MEWATSADLKFNIVGGYFLGPVPTARIGWPRWPGPRRRCNCSGRQRYRNGALINDGSSQARADVSYWHATTFVLSDRHGNGEQLPRP
jgi:hypothetical protein